MESNAQRKSFLPDWAKRLIKFMLAPWINWKRNRIYQEAINNPKRITDSKYRQMFGKDIDYDNPISLNEKIHRLKFYSDTSLWPLLADKYRVRNYVKKKGLAHILNDLYAVFEEIDDIDISSLPNSFVMKSNKGYGDILVVKDKSEFTNKAIKQYFKSKQRKNSVAMKGEYHYEDIKPCYIAEKLLVEENTCGYLTDYKFYCFNGKAKYILVCSERHKNGFTIDTFDVDWKAYQVRIPAKNIVTGKGEIERPHSLEQMIEICEKLSQGLPFVRVDLYEIYKKPIFGEMTLTPAGGYLKHYTEEFINELGSYVKLPEKNENRHASKKK